MSAVLHVEVSQNPHSQAVAMARALLDAADEYIVVDELIARRTLTLEALGYDAGDAEHLAVAEAAQADYLLTVDDRFESRAARGVGSPRVRVLNPVKWRDEVLYGRH